MNGVKLFLFRPFHTTAFNGSSVFMKRQKKVDPEVAKVREERKRRRIEKEIREIKKHSKKPKPVEEMTIDIISAKNINERYREPIKIDEETEDYRAVTLKSYSKSRNELMILDDQWIRKVIKNQEKALNALKRINPQLFESAVKFDPALNNFVIYGPTISPFINDYHSPDGEYIDTTKTWI